MEHGMRIPETPTPESLLTAWGAGALPRREVLRRAALLGLGAAVAGRVRAAGPAAAQTTQKRGWRRRRAHMPPARRVRRA